MTRRDRLVNRYLINFVDHRSKYCRVFLAKIKDISAMSIKHLLMALNVVSVTVYTFNVQTMELNTTLWMFFARKLASLAKQVSDATRLAMAKPNGCTAPS